jgi:GNAT superfamily N-acetyltransferase
MKTISNHEITSEIINKLSILEEEIFGDKATGAEAFLAQHTDGEGVFAALNDDGEPVGFFDFLFLSDNQMQQYLIDGNYRALKNIKLQNGNNNLYISTLAVKPEYRNKGLVQSMSRDVAAWLHKLKQSPNITIKTIFAEAVSVQGANYLSRSMGMIPIDQNKTQDRLGFYYSPDLLEEFTKKNIQQ